MKTVLVTGANKGIGLEVARQLATREFHVFVGARDAEAGRRLRAVNDMRTAIPPVGRDQPSGLAAGGKRSFP